MYGDARATLGRYSSAAMMAGSASALAAFYAWNTLPFWGYQFVCVSVAAVAAVAFELSFQLQSGVHCVLQTKSSSGDDSDDRFCSQFN